MAAGRVKSLTYILTRFLLAAGFVLVALAALWLFGIQLGANMGLVYPAAYAQRQATAYAATLAASRGAFDAAAVPELVDYALFGSGGEVLESNATNRSLQELQAQYGVREDAAATFAAVPLADGTTLLLHWRYLAEFRDPALRAALPSFEYLWDGFILLAMVLSVVFQVRWLRKMLAAKLQAVAEVSHQIGAHNLDVAMPRTGIRELELVTGAMGEMRDALKTSLVAQWQLERQREREIAALAHDLKTPLTIIGGNADLLAEEALPNEQQRLVGFIQSNTRRAMAYVQALGVAAQSGVDEAAAQLESDAVLRAVLDAARPLAEAKGVRLQTDFALPGHFRARRQMLERALINILDNAVRHTPAGGTVTFRAGKREAGLAFCVEDGGAGFSPEALRHATERFWMDDAARTAQNHQGLGLWIAQQAAETHSGTLEICNGPTGGVVCIVIDVGEKPA